jgi:hypothetical protein
MPSDCRDFYALTPEQRVAAFRTYPVEKQFELYRCGMRREPPDMGLALYIADGGEKAIPFLLDKLRTSDDEPTQSQIIDIFEAMSRRGYLQNRRDVVDQIRENVTRMKRPFFKKMGETSLKNIEETRQSGP